MSRHPMPGAPPIPDECDSCGKDVTDEDLGAFRYDPVIDSGTWFHKDSDAHPQAGHHRMQTSEG